MSAPSAEALTKADGNSPPGDRQRAKWRSTLTRLDIKITPYLLIAPFFALFGIFGLFPLFYNGIASLQNRDLIDGNDHSWTLDNYRKLATDTDFFQALFNTLGLFVLSTFPQLLFSLVLASLLNRQLRAQTLLRMGILVPFITPIAASSLVFGAIFAKEYGLANAALHAVGLPTVNFRATRVASWFAIITMVNWRWTGYWAVIFLASMQSIPKDLYEAATVDGASPWTQFWRLTVPLLRPMLIFSVVISSIGGLQLFAEPLLFDDNPNAALGGADSQFRTIAMYIYFVSQRKLELGYGAAISWALFLIIVIVAGINALVVSRVGRR